MVNGPEVWTRPGWTMNWWWIDSWMAVFLCFTCLLTLSMVLFRKKFRKFLNFPENFLHSIFPEKLQPLCHQFLKWKCFSTFWSINIGVYL